MCSLILHAISQRQELEPHHFVLPLSASPMVIHHHDTAPQHSFFFPFG
jgi:hypothetical protein